MKTKTTIPASLLAAATLASLLLAQGADGAEFHPISAITSDTAGADFYVAANLIEGLGVGFDANPPHARTSTLTWVTSDQNGNGVVGDYFDPLPDPAPRLVFDLGEDVTLAEISLWAYPVTGNALKDFNVRFATSAEGPDGAGSSITFNAEFVALTTPVVRQSFMFGQAVTARYVELTPLDNYYEIIPPGGDRVGLTEVAFEKIDTSPSPKADLGAPLTLAPASSPVEFAIQVRNLGQQPLTLGAGSFSGPNAAAFTLLAAPASLPPLSAATITARFNPAGLPIGNASATLSFPTNDPGAATASLAITGVIPPEPANTFHPITAITSATVDWDFFPAINLRQGIGVGFNAEQPHNQLGTSTWVTNAPNGGTADYFNPVPDPAPLLTVDLGSDVVLNEISLWGYALTNANGMSDFSLRFATSAEGPEGATSIPYNPTFVLPHGAANRHSFWFPAPVTARYVLITPLDNYFGMGLAPGGDRVGIGEVAFEIMPSKTGKALKTPARADFPATETTQTFTIVLRNTGSEAVAVSQFQISGENAGSFSLVSAPATVAAHSHAAVQVAFDPEAAGLDTASATLSLQSDDPALPDASIPLAAKAILNPVEFYPVIDVISATVDFYSAYNLIEGIGLGFGDTRPHLQPSAGLLWVTEAPNGATGDYFDPLPDPAPSLVFDLGEDVPLDEISVWGYSISAGNSMSDFSLRFATSAEGSEGAGGSISYNPTFTADSNSTFRQSFPFSQTVTARYVELTPLDNHYGIAAAGGDRVGLGEAAFRVASPAGPALPAFAITSITASGGQVTLSFQSVSGGKYNIHRSTNLSTWAPLAGGLDGAAGSTTYTDAAPPAAPSPAFYRVERTQ